MMKVQNCFSGSPYWSSAWQAEMNAKGHRASLTVIEEYPELNLVEMPPHQKGYDVVTLGYPIFIETKNRDRAKIVDITKPQSEISDIISMYDENWVGYHCLTKDYNKIAKITTYYRNNGFGKYLAMTRNQFKAISVLDLRELVGPLMEAREKKQTLNAFYS